MNSIDSLIYPLKVQWNITNQCNSKCIYCSATAGKKSPNELNTAKCLLVVEKLARAGVLRVFLQGGEIFLRNDIWDIIARIRELKMRVSFATNGYLTARTLENLVKYNDLFESILINVNALNDDTNQIITQRNWKIAQVLQTIDLLLQAGHNIRVQTVVNRCNIDELIEIHETIAAIGVKNYVIMPLFLIGSANHENNKALLHISRHDYYRNIITLVKNSRQSNCKVVLTERPKISSLIYQLTGVEVGNIELCQAGYSFFCIGVKGLTYPCPPVNPFARNYIGANILDEEVEEIWNSTIFNSFRRFHARPVINDECENCRYRENSICHPCDCWPLCMNAADQFFG